MPRVFWLCLAILACAQVQAQNVTRLYDRAKLQADAARYGEQIRAEYQETILPQLTEAERAALREIRIEVPPVGRSGDPFDFYTDGRTVYLPALSLRFFADLCLANAWLNAHGYDGTTVRDYVGLLFREANISASAPLPPVFRALGVPENAREESAVADRANRNFANAVFFLLAHELGHVVHKHRAGEAEATRRRQQEVEADAFAIDLLRRIGQVPLGLEFWFDLERIRHQAPRELPTDAEWQKYLAGLAHPVTTERLHALAAELEKAPEDFAKNQPNQALWTTRAKMFAQFFRMSAPFAGNSAARVVEYKRVRELRLVSLKPRKPGFAAPTGDGAEEDFQGLFRVRRVPVAGAGDEIDLLLLRNGEEVTGSYANAEVEGTLAGKISEGILRAEWKVGAAGGEIVMRTTGAKLSGTWRRAGEDKEGGTREGVRVQRK
ncbi:hypothetical protein BH20VER2_BH20VER2_08040 [soil metagenome]